MKTIARSADSGLSRSEERNRLANPRATIDRVDEVMRAIGDLASTKVLVGIPEENAPRREGTATNALIGYVHEMGSPARNIPARPWLVPGVQEGIPQILPALRAAGTAALEGNAARVDQAFNAAGLAAQNSVRARISSNIPPPLSPKTIAARRRRSKGSKYRRKATTAADVTTLVDTGQMRNAVTFVLRKDRG